MRKCVAALLFAGLAACASVPRAPVTTRPQEVVVAPRTPGAASATTCISPYAPAQEDLSKRGDYVAGGLYRPGERDRVPGTIPDIACIAEPRVVALPRSKVGNRPVYSVLDREYRVLDDTRGFAEEGLASYYGEKFHGRRTSNLEVYDMYAFSAAHKTLPLPSFARVTNLDNGSSVVVRVNDRGPFHDGRVMDLSLAAAVKLGIYARGTGRVRVEALQPGEVAPGVVVAQAIPALVDSRTVTRSALQAPTAEGRYAMQPSTDNAAQFAGWMQQRGVRIATGRPMPVAPSGASPLQISPRVAGAGAAYAGQAAGPDRSTSASDNSYVTRPINTSVNPTFAAPDSGSGTTLAPLNAASDAAFPLATDQAPSIPMPLPATTVSAAATPISSPPTRVAFDPSISSGRPVNGDTVVLQVASFATRDNAERALARLQQAGIDNAQVVDGIVNSQSIWRLRVGPLPIPSEFGIIARLAGLGFGSTRRVHD